MSPTLLGRHGRGALRPRFVCALLLVWPCSVTCLAAEPDGSSTADRLVQEALLAEVSGDAARHAALMTQAVHVAPEHKLARWHLGQIAAGDDWLPVEEAQQAAASDPRQIEYGRLRAEIGDSPEGQLELARWCRKNDLFDEARLHWMNVLSVAPNHEEALRALGVRWFGGQLMTYAQVKQAKHQMKESRKAAKEWEPRVAKWQRMLAAGDIASRDKVLDEVRGLTDPHAIPALEDATLYGDVDTTPQFERCRHLSLAFVEALDAMPRQAATESLLRHAVYSPVSDVRKASIDALKKRPLHDYVPLLLDGLAMPIESTFNVTTDPDGSVHYWHSLYRDGQMSDWSVENSFNAWQHDFRGLRTLVDRAGRIQGYRMPRESDVEVAQRKAAVATRYQQRFAISAVTVEEQVEEINQAANELNQLLFPVLASATGQELGDNPQAWWDWWREYNEYDSSGEDPVYEDYTSDSDHYYYRVPKMEPYRPPGQTSCFARGTLVWTKTGRRVIESLELGDLVLSQNPKTGELTYKPVVGRTVRPPTAIMRLSLGGEELLTTLGHPLWVAGLGWRMAKELGDGAILHGVNGPVSVDSIEQASEQEAFNLIVADFNTYFVGESGVLVHDNTPREPTTATVPGLAAK